jgi:4-amino-4-deoxy-L-arabinose transferase-like glycosyltransferase
VWPLGCVVTGALLLRLVPVWLNPLVPISDESSYLLAVHHPSLGVAWPFTLECRPPGYPLFLRSLALLGLGRRDYLVVQALLSALTLVPLFVFGRRWIGERAALAAAVLLAVYPPFILYSSLFMSETLFVFLLVTAIALIARPDAGRAGHLGGGLVLAGALLVRSAIKLFVPITLLWVLACPWWPRRERFVRVGLLVLGLTVPFGLWTVRNAVVHGELITADCQTMFNIWQGNARPQLQFYDVARLYYGHSESPSAREAFAREKIIEAIRPAPIAWAIRKTIEQVPRLLGPRHETRSFWTVGRLYTVPDWFISAVTGFESAAWLFMAVAGLAGLVLAAPDPRRTLVLLLGGTTVVTGIVAFALARHRFPMVPFLALGAGLLLFREPPAWAPSPGRRLAAATAVAALCVAILG